MTYSDIRAKARENLRGRWGVSVAAAFVAAILGALLASSGNMVQIIEKLSEESASGIAPVLALLASAASVISLVNLILGGVVQLGYARFLLNQHDGREHTVKDLFSQFDRFSVGFLQLFLRDLFVALWCILLVIPGIIKSFSHITSPEIPVVLRSHAVTVVPTFAPIIIPID